MAKKKTIYAEKKMGLHEYEIFRKKWEKATERIKRASIKRKINLGEIPIIGRVE